jgi:hypothetical protein
MNVNISSFIFQYSHVRQLCAFLQKIIILATSVCCPASNFVQSQCNSDSLGQGIRKSEAEHQENEARVTLCLMVAYGNIRWFIF